MLMSLELCHPKTKRLKRHQTTWFLHILTKENMMNLQVSTQNFKLLILLNLLMNL